MDAPFVIRRAVAADLPALGRLGAELVRVHHGFDRERFLAPTGNLEDGYARFLAREIERDDVVVMVAEAGAGVVGYVYAGIEAASWKELREEAGFVHDVLVAAEARGQGMARALVEAAAAWLEERGAARVMLWTAERNEAGQRLFASLGFRTTMREMTRERRRR